MKYPKRIYLKYIVEIITMILIMQFASKMNAQNYGIEPELEFSSAKLNARGMIGNPSLQSSGVEHVSNYDGNLLLKYELNEKIQNGLSVNLSLLYNANVEHRVFREAHDIFDQEGYAINVPEWIIGLNGYAIQTLNFENNFYLGKSGQMYDGGDQTDPILGEEIPLLIPGYHYTNRFDVLPPAIQKEMYDYISILMADGSKKVLVNTDILTTSSSSQEGLYIETDPNNAGHAIVKNVSGQSYTREMWYKPGDGLTYYYQEYSVDYYTYSSQNRIYDPKIMYLTKIINSDGAHLRVTYSDPVCDVSGTKYGRKVFNDLYFHLTETGSSWSIGGLDLNASGSHLASMDINLNSRVISGIVENQSGSGIYSRDRTGSSSVSKIKYFDEVIDGEGNSDLISYNSSATGTRKYEYEDQEYTEKRFYLVLPLYLVEKIDYYDGEISELLFFHTPFTDDNCTTTNYLIAFDFASMKDYGCMMEVTYRDNFTNYMLKERKKYKSFSLDSLIWTENYGYELNHDILDTYGNRFLQVKNIKTYVEKENETSESSSSPETKNIYNFSRFYALNFF